MALLPMDPRLWGERFPASIRGRKNRLRGAGNALGDERKKLRSG